MRTARTSIKDFDCSAHFLSEEEARAHVQEVRFPSRAGNELEALVWRSRPTGPTVVITHGHGTSNRKYANLAAANALFRAGFNVLAVNLRNTAQSERVAPAVRTTWGYTEHADTLGAWDYAREHLAGGDATLCGLLGASLGGLISALAFAQEPRVPALFLHSPALSLDASIDSSFVFSGVPRFLLWLFAEFTALHAESLAGVPIREFQPAKVLAESRRPGGTVAVMGIEDDGYTPWSTHAQEYVDLLTSLGHDVSTWKAELGEGLGAGSCTFHLKELLVLPDEYKRFLCTFWARALRADVDCPP